MEGDVGADAADDELVEGDAHAGQGLGAGLAEADDLGDEGIVQARDAPAAVDAGVDPDAAGAGRMMFEGAAKRGGDDEREAA